jgi:hypothetical protein
MYQAQNFIIIMLNNKSLVPVGAGFFIPRKEVQWYIVSCTDSVIFVDEKGMFPKTFF